MEKTLIFLREKQVNSHAYHWNCQQSAFLSSRLGYIVRLYCSFHYLFIPPSRGADPVFIPDGHTHTHTHARGPENGNGDGGEFWKSPPMYFYKGFRSRLPWICMYFCANPDKSYRVTAKIASIYNTSPLEKIEFKSEKKKKKPEFRNDRISPPFFPSSTLYTEIHSRRGSFVNVSLPW